jgi:hypothetical protein
LLVFVALFWAGDGFAFGGDADGFAFVGDGFAFVGDADGFAFVGDADGFGAFVGDGFAFVGDADGFGGFVGEAFAEFAVPSFAAATFVDFATMGFVADFDFVALTAVGLVGDFAGRFLASCLAITFPKVGDGAAFARSRTRIPRSRLSNNPEGNDFVPYDVITPGVMTSYRTMSLHLA